MRTIRAIRARSRTTTARSLRARSVLMAAAALLALALAAVAAGCGGSGGSGPSLEGTAWKLTGWSISSQDPNDFTITAQFADGRIGGTSAVNQYGGPYTTGDDGAVLGRRPRQHDDGRSGAGHAGGDGLHDAARRRPRQYEVDGETLTLLDAGGNESLIYTATVAAHAGRLRMPAAVSTGRR